MPVRALALRLVFFGLAGHESIGIAICAPYAYITEQATSTVSVIDTATNTIVKKISVLPTPMGVAVSAHGTNVYIGSAVFIRLSVIDAATNTVTAQVPVGQVSGVAVNFTNTRVYVANRHNPAPPVPFPVDSVSVIDTATNAVIANVPVGLNPFGVVVHPDGSRVYVANAGANSMSVIDAATNTVSATIASVGNGPNGVAVHPNGTRVYVTSGGSNTISVVDTATNSVSSTIPVGPPLCGPVGVAVNPAGTRVFVALSGASSVAVVDTASNLLVATVPVGFSPWGISVDPSGKSVYVANFSDNSVSVIDAATNAVVTTITGFAGPLAFGQFVEPAPVLPASAVEIPSSTTRGLVTLLLVMALVGAYQLRARRRAPTWRGH